MFLLAKMKGALEKMTKAFAPQGTRAISILGKQKYTSEGVRKSSAQTSRSVLSMAKYNQDSGVSQNGKRFGAGQEK